MRKLLFAWGLTLTSLFSCFASCIDKDSLCPIKGFIEINSPIELAQKFYGDTITFLVPKAEDIYFESFRYLTPETLWIKKCPKNTLPQEHKHFRLHTNFYGIPGWGVNAHREYTPGTSLNGHTFVFLGTYTEKVEYLGSFTYVLLEDIVNRKVIKWDFKKNENNGIIIFSPSILRRLSLQLKNQDFFVEESDSTYTLAKCSNISLYIDVKPNIWQIFINADFKTSSYNITSTNWKPRFFLKRDSDKL